MNAYVSMWKNYANFTGKSTRSELFPAWLVHAAIIYLIIFVSITLGVTAFGTVGTLYAIVTAIPFLSLLIRRLRDAGMSWLWCFILAIPVLGFIVLLLLACKESV